MLSNLVGNAIKFTRQGHIRIEAREISRNEDGALLEFAFSDSGVGIAAEKQSLLFPTSLRCCQSKNTAARITILKRRTNCGRPTHAGEPSR